MRKVFQRRTRQNTANLRIARNKLKVAVKNAKNKWIKCHCQKINYNTGTKAAWNAIKSLKEGLYKTKPSTSKQMKRQDGSLCKTPEENASVFFDHFQALYNRQPYIDENVLDGLPQHPIAVGCDHLPTEKEIFDAVKKLKNNAPGESGIKAQIWKSL